MDIDAKKINFSEYQCKYQDVSRLTNPLKEQEYTLTDKRTIAKMRAAGRYPIPEELLN